MVMRGFLQLSLTKLPGISFCPRFNTMESYYVLLSEQG